MHYVCFFSSDSNKGRKRTLNLGNWNLMHYSNKLPKPHLSPVFMHCPLLPTLMHCTKALIMWVVALFCVLESGWYILRLLGCALKCITLCLPPVLCLLSHPYWKWWRDRTHGAIDKRGQEERGLGRASLSHSEFNINLGWKDSSSPRHPNTAERHDDISIRQEGEKRERKRKNERESVLERKREWAAKINQYQIRLNFVSLRQLPRRTSRDGEWAGFKSNPIKQ